MAHQTSENQRKQTTPHIIGRLMDADFFEGHVFYFSLHTSRGSEQVLVWPTDRKGH
jgi:hypothetical protein